MILRFCFACTVLANLLIGRGYCSPSNYRRQLAADENQSGATSPVDTSRFHFSYPLELPAATLRGNGACSPHSTYDYVAASVMHVPSLETDTPALRFWQATPTGEGAAKQIFYFDLPTGNIVVATRTSNWASQSSSYSYQVLTTTLPDRDQYTQVLAKMLDMAGGIADGKPVDPSDLSLGYTCNRPQPAGASVATYLKRVAAEVSGSSSSGDLPELRPTETLTATGCIAEGAANYKGDPLRDVIPGVGSADACCQLCQAEAGCNIWVWCSLTSGCPTGGGDASSIFPYLGCHLKTQANLTDPQAQAEAWARGPTTPFTSGRTVRPSGGSRVAAASTSVG